MFMLQRFCQINRIYVGPFEDIFRNSYSTVHRLETNKLRNVAKFFAHLLFTDAISWEVLTIVKLNEEDTTSSSRIFIKILFQELSEYIGLAPLNTRLKDVYVYDLITFIYSNLIKLESLFDRLIFGTTDLKNSFRNL